MKEQGERVKRIQAHLKPSIYKRLVAYCKAADISVYRAVNVLVERGLDQFEQERRERPIGRNSEVVGGAERGYWGGLQPIDNSRAEELEPQRRRRRR